MYCSVLKDRSFWHWNSSNHFLIILLYIFLLSFGSLLSFNFSIESFTSFSFSFFWPHYPACMILIPLPQIEPSHSSKSAESWSLDLPGNSRKVSFALTITFFFSLRTSFHFSLYKNLHLFLNWCQTFLCRPAFHLFVFCFVLFSRSFK